MDYLSIHLQLNSDKTSNNSGFPPLGMEASSSTRCKNQAIGSQASSSTRPYTPSHSTAVLSSSSILDSSVPMEVCSPHHSGPPVNETASSSEFPTLQESAAHSKRSNNKGSYNKGSSSFKNVRPPTPHSVALQTTSLSHKNSEIGISTPLVQGRQEPLSQASGPQLTQNVTPNTPYSGIQTSSTPAHLTGRCFNVPLSPSPAPLTHKNTQTSSENTQEHNISEFTPSTLNSVVSRCAKFPVAPPQRVPTRSAAYDSSGVAGALHGCYSPPNAQHEGTVFIR